MDYIYLFFIFIAVELFESNWQKSNDLYGLINNNYLIFKKKIFLYFSLHLAFFYTIFLAIYLNNFGFWMSSIFILKFLDISFKLSIMKKLSLGISIEEIVPINVKMIPVFRYMNVIIYPLTFLIATMM